MAGSIADQILEKIDQARELYYRLILVVGPEGSGKTSALQKVSASTSVPLINVNLELSRRMLDLTERRQALQELRNALGLYQLGIEDLDREPAEDLLTQVETNLKKIDGKSSVQKLVANRRIHAEH